MKDKYKTALAKLGKNFIGGYLSILIPNGFVLGVTYGREVGQEQAKADSSPFDVSQFNPKNWPQGQRLDLIGGAIGWALSLATMIAIGISIY